MMIGDWNNGLKWNQLKWKIISLHSDGESTGGLLGRHPRRNALVRPGIQILLDDALQFKVRVQFLFAIKERQSNLKNG